MEVSEVASILPQMENVIHDIRGISIQKFIHYGQQPVNVLLVGHPEIQELRNSIYLDEES